jgi:hypothetical protein
MAMVLAEVALQRTLQIGLKNLRGNADAFIDIFAQYDCPAMRDSYGEDYIQQIYDWFNSSTLPVLQAWSFDPQRVPGISIHLADESEDESKAAIGDHWGFGAEAEILTGPVSVSLDIGIHADKSKDHVLWMYYIILYILYKEKMTARGLGLQLYTYRANEYNKESKYMGDNVWSRWIRFRCTVQHYLSGDTASEVDSLIIDMDAASLDNNNPNVDISDIEIDLDEE